ncbi:MAG TPA: hypothetical protein VKV04_22035 [Verrucomicrobiae bacterium]|nr:hypothetical protein [Verrucomicrobiae bacterium]
MSVQVDIFDRENLANSPPEIRVAAEKLEAAEQKRRTLGRYDLELSNYVHQINNAVQILVTNPPGCLSAQDEATWTNSKVERVESWMDAVRGTNDIALSITEKARLTSSPALRSEEFLRAWETFEKARVLHNALPGRFNSMVSNEFFMTIKGSPCATNIAVALFPKEAPEQAVKTMVQHVVNQASNSVQQVATSFEGEGDLLNEPLASTVVGAPEECWRHAYNRTYANGMFGDTDIAVKMDSVANFTMKGVRLDADKMIQSTFDSLQLAVKIAASTYGIPVPAPGGTATNSAAAPTASSSPQVQTLNTQVQILTIQQAQVSIMDSILLQRNVLTNAPTAAAYAQAIKQIQANFAANRSVLSP